MKKKVLLAILGLLLFACSTDKYKEIVFPFCYTNEEEFFPIVAWYGPPDDYVTDKHFKNLADCNFTVSLSFYGTPGKNRRALEIAEKYNVKLIVHDDRINARKPVTAATYRTLDSIITEYAGYFSLYAYHIIDEPGAYFFQNIKKIVDYLKIHDPAHYCYVNLYPNYADEGQLGTATYVEHVRKFMDIVSPRILSFDNYPILTWGFRTEFFENMEVIRSEALKNNVPFWAFTRVLETAKYPSPEEGHLRFQLYADLAYGAKGVQYFRYWPKVTENPSIVTSSGDITIHYYSAKKINEEILTLAPILRNLTSVDVYHTEPLPEGCKSLPENFIFDIKSARPLLIGHFRDAENLDYYFLVNRNYNFYTVIDLKLTENVKDISEIARSRETAKKSTDFSKGKIWHLRIEAGDGRLIRVIK